jgi:hypothetical protein
MWTLKKSRYTGRILWGIQKNHPELAANIREDRSDFERDINKIFYPTSKS